MNLRNKHFQPDFDQLISILNRKPAKRPVLFEFLIDDVHTRRFAGINNAAETGTYEYFLMLIDAYRNLGYDFAPIYAWHTNTLQFPLAEHASASSRSQNDGAMITDEASFDSYKWPDPQLGNYELYKRLLPDLPEGMKLMACSWGGVLENVTDIVGFENLCLMYLLDPELTSRIFNHVGNRLLEYYKIVSAFDSVGCCMVNDDWGFRNQTMFPPDMMRRYVYPWTREIVKTIHENEKPAIFHSCGNLKDVMPEVINDLGMDAKHSFEDAIYPVEDAYDLWSKDIAILGGIDVDFLCQRSQDDIQKRAFELLEKTFEKGSYALGSGNSIAGFVPTESLLSLIAAVKTFEQNLK